MDSRTILGGRYVLARAIASGGMATVHLARQLGAGGFARTVAVKRLHERFARDPDFLAMFLDEARLVARIRHPNVVQTLDVVAEGGELFIVMEYVHGESLLRCLQAAARQGAAVPLPIAAAVAVAMLHGLDAAHEARGESGEPLGLVHRDVSPHNVLVGSDGIARVLDFGIALASERIQTTHEGQLKGKLAYMAPEQITRGPIDRRTDVHAAAIVLWEALTGAKLVQAASEGAVVQQILAGQRRPPSALRPDVPAALDAVVMKGLALEPSARFASAREMAHAIERAAPIATTSELAAWVHATCAASLEARARLIASVEAQSSSSNRERARDSLRNVSAAPPPGVVTIAPPRPPPPRSRAVPVIAIAAAAVALAASMGATAFLVGRVRALGPVTNATTSAEAPRAAASIAAPACPDGMMFVPGGRFFMGSDEDRPDERPAHHVTVNAFCMDRWEVTVDAYRACSERGDCKRAGVTNKWEGLGAADARIYDPLCNASSGARGDHPINCVDWSMADRFCRATGKRLPTEAEWEFAARGSDGRKYPWGDAAPSGKHLNACGAECVLWLKAKGVRGEGSLHDDDDGFATTAPVGSFPLGASRWGVEDIVGNVWEWVSDWYGPYVDADQLDPRGPASGSSRVVRGGSWNGTQADWVRPSFRFHLPETTRSHGVGFRCAR